MPQASIQGVAFMQWSGNDGAGCAPDGGFPPAPNGISVGRRRTFRGAEQGDDGVETQPRRRDSYSVAGADARQQGDAGRRCWRRYATGVAVPMLGVAPFRALVSPCDPTERRDPIDEHDSSLAERLAGRMESPVIMHVACTGRAEEVICASPECQFTIAC